MTPTFFYLVSRASFILLGTATLSVTIGTFPGVAQDSRHCFVRANATSDPTATKADLLRARNLARQAAESYNGGLQYYRADNSMHARIAQAPCIENDNGSWTFTFKGFRPGVTTPFVETVVTVDRRNWQVSVDANNQLP